MSNVYQPKRKELAKVKVVSTQVYENNRSKLKFVGRVKRGYTTFITTQSNKKTGKCSFVDDTSALTKKTKNDIVHFFSDKANGKKGYAIRRRTCCLAARNFKKNCRFLSVAKKARARVFAW